MSTEILNWIHRRLSDDEEVIVPLKKLWKDWCVFHGQLSYDAFARTVLDDGRFEEMYSVNQNPEVEGFGFFSGPRIRLRSREITGTCVLNLIRLHNDCMVKTLLRASELLKNDAESESADALHQAISMCEELRPALSPWVHLQPNKRAARKTRKKPRSKTA